MTDKTLRRVDDDKIDEALKKLIEIQASLAAQNTEIIRLSKTAQENKESIKGNSKPGLEVNMALVQEAIKRMNGILSTMAVIVGTEIIGLLFAFLTHMISFP